MVLIQMDANAKVGSAHIADYPNDISENGKLLLDFVKRQNLRILNSSSKCSGTVTRTRVTKDGVEIAVLDFIIGCDALANMMIKMVIDEDRINVLTKYATAKGVKKTIESDHNPMYAEFTLQYNVKKPAVRKEIFNFKDKACQKKFFEVTSFAGKFGSCFNPSRSVDENINKFYKSLDDTFHQCFKKVRIKSKNMMHDDASKNALMSKMNLQTKLKLDLKSAKCNLAKTIITQTIEDLESSIADKIAETNASKISSQVAELSTMEGRFSQTGMWKVKNRICPRPNDPPMAKRDSEGNIITAPSQLKTLYMETYKHRLRHRDMSAKYEDILHLKTELWELRLINLKKKVTAPWKISHIDAVLKSLKNNQSRDPMGVINEIFKHGIIGDELKHSTLSLMNSVKETMHIPPNMQLSNITMIYKH